MREMKDSGIEWVGAIPQDWQLSKIGSLYTQRNEKVSDKDYQPLSVTMQGILPQLATAAKTDDGDNRKLVRVGDFAINSRSDRRGSCGISPLDGSVSLINIILTPRTAMHPGYYNWLFHTTLFADEFYKWGHGIVADLWTTRWQEMKSITVPVPEYVEQERIAAFLDAECAEIDTVLEKTRASIEEYKKLKQAVITQAVTKGIRGDRPMKDSGIEWIGDIPAEWDYTKAKNCVDIQNGSDPKTEGSIPVYGSGASSFKTCGEYKEGPSVLIGRKGATLHIPHYISTKFWNVDTDKAHRYALQKVYISLSYKRDMRPGDLLVIYRKGITPRRKAYESVVSTICVVDEVRYNFSSKEDYLKYCENRTVFSPETLNQLWEKHRNNLLMVKFIFVKSLTKRITLGELWDSGIVPRNGGPRPFDHISDADFDTILAKSQTKIHFERQ